MGYTIRPLERADLDPITRVIAACDTDDASPARRDLLEYLEDGGLCRAQGNFVACDKRGQPVGLVGYFVDREHEPGCDVYWGTWMYVDPALHGRGVGLALWQHVRAHLLRLGCRKVYANVSSDPGYDRARRFYEIAGFRLEHVHRDYFGPGEHSELWGLRLAARRPVAHEPVPPPPAPPPADVPLRVVVAKARHERALGALYRSWGARFARRADAWLWRYLHRPEPERRLFVAGAKGVGMLGAAGIEPAEEEEVDKEVFWVRYLSTRPGAVEPAAGMLLQRIEQRQRARGARALYTSLPAIDRFAPLAGALERAGFAFEGRAPDYFADGVDRAFYVKRLDDSPPPAREPGP